MHLLIDGKNLLYRGIYASLNTNTSTFVIISRMMHFYYHNFGTREVHVFWDDNKENLWRKNIYPKYKDSSCREKSSAVSDDINKYQIICEDIWENMNIRQYKLHHMEADDLIYAFCHLRKEDIIIVSNDGDMLQMPYRLDNVKVYNPYKRKMCDRPTTDPIVFKCLSGDKSDNIDGYEGIGPKKAQKCIDNPDILNKLLSDNGGETYLLNRNLIDLSLCPGLNDNMMYIMKNSYNKTKFDKKLITEMVYSKHKIRGIMAEYKNIIAPFNRR